MATFPDCGALVFGSKSECPLAVFGPVASKPPKYSTTWKGNRAQITGNIFAQCSLAQRQLVRIQGKPWPANLGFLFRAPARRCNLRPWPGLWLWWSNSLQYVLCCTCTAYTFLYAVYIYIYFRYHHASSNHISFAWFLSGLCYITCHFFYLVFVMIYACVCKYFIVDKRLMFFFLQLPARLQMRDSKTR